MQLGSERSGSAGQDDQCRHDMSDRFHVITGGPGSGKSSLIAALTAHGVASMPEAGRAIIRDQLEIGGSALPWGDRGAFASAMLTWDMRSFREASQISGPVVFDRGIPDTIGYLRLCGLGVPDALLQAAQLRRYAREVFIAPHWPAIYVQDAERKQSPAEAKRTYEAMADVYRACGYDVVDLPLLSVAARAEFVLSRIGLI